LCFVSSLPTLDHIRYIKHEAQPFGSISSFTPSSESQYVLSPNTSPLPCFHSPLPIDHLASSCLLKNTSSSWKGYDQVPHATPLSLHSSYCTPAPLHALRLCLSPVSLTYFSHPVCLALPCRACICSQHLAVLACILVAVLYYTLICKRPCGQLEIGKSSPANANDWDIHR
jgi:hypothetical protein